MNNKYTYNIFGALAHRRTKGVIMEFALWCATCFAALMSMIAIVVGAGQATWIVMLVFAIGLGVLLAFRLKGIAMLYGAVVFPFFTEILHFIKFRQNGYDYGFSYSPLNILLFIIALMLAIAVVICMSIHGFSKYDLGTITTILMSVDTAVLLFLHIMMYAMSFFGSEAASANEYARWNMGEGGYWFGTVCFWMLLAVVLLEYIFCIWGPMDLEHGRVNKGKIIRRNIQPVNPQTYYR